MITTKTVLVLGAGASKPYGFPLGRELVREMRQFAGSAEAEDWCKGMQGCLLSSGTAMIQHWHDLHALSQMRDLNTRLEIARPQSIDEFLERRPDIADVGKLTIAIVLSRAERMSRKHLYNDATEGDWYDFLKSRLLSSPEDFGQNQLRIITFNYERSLESYLYESLQPYYGSYLSGAQWVEYGKMVSQIEIVHIYGSLGPLPWQSETNTIPYGTQAHKEIWQASKNIRILHEATGDEKVDENLSKARQWLGWADRVLFLGFGFHKDNVDRLALKRLPRHGYGKEVSATCFRLSATNRTYAERCDPNMDPRPAIWFAPPDADCYEFLHDHAVLS